MNQHLELFQATLPDGYYIRYGSEDNAKHGSRMLWLRVKTPNNAVLEVRQRIDMGSRSLEEAEQRTWQEMIRTMEIHIHDNG